MNYSFSFVHYEPNLAQKQIPLGLLNTKKHAYNFIERVGLFKPLNDPSDPPWTEAYNALTFQLVGSDGITTDFAFSVLGQNKGTLTSALVFNKWPYGLGGSDSNNDFGVRVCALPFSDDVDNFDFRSIQLPKEVIQLGINALTHAGGGADVVHLWGASGDYAQWLSPVEFFAGAGNDEIFGGAGEATIFGEAGNDLFNFRPTEGAELTATDVWVRVDGGENDKSDKSNAGMDLILLPDAADDYTISVDESKSATTLVATGQGSLSAGQTFELRAVELALFKNPIANPVRITNPTSLSNYSSIISEAAKLMTEAYNATPTTPFGAADAAQDRGWHKVAAIEIGIKPSNFPPEWTFVDGVYERVVPVPIFPDNDAAAMILSGLAGGSRTLSIVFKGSDPPKVDPLDWIYDILQLRGHYYQEYQSLVDGIKTYLSYNYTKLDKILVSGHSLGGAMVQQFVADITNAGYGAKIEAFTFASIGGEQETATSAFGKIMHFIHVGDFANQLNKLGIPNLGGVDGRYGSQVWIDSTESRSFAEADFSISMHSDTGYETDVNCLIRFAFQTTSVFGKTSLAAALRSGSVWQDAAWNNRIQILPGSDYSDNLNPVSGDNFVLGGDGNDSISLLANPASVIARYIDGGVGSNRILLPLTPADYSIAAAQSDGGRLVTYLPSGGQQKVGTVYNIDKLVFPFVGATVAILNSLRLAAAGVGGSVSSDTVQAADQYVVHLDGTPTAVQTVASGQTAVTVDHSFDYLDTGAGTVAVTGTNLGDIVVLGTGTVAVEGGTGNDLFFAGDAASAGPGGIHGGDGDDLIITGARKDVIFGDGGNDDIDGGGEADRMAGGLGDDVFHVDDAGDLVVESADSGADTVLSTISYVLPSDVEKLVLSGSLAIDGTGNELDNTIIGNAEANRLDGMLGSDMLAGGDGGDTLIGGDGHDDLDGGTNPEVGQPGAQGDVMLGGAGDDTYHVDSGLDLVDEGSYFPAFGFGGTDTIISTTDFYWDIASVGEIDQVAENVVDVNNDGVTIVGGVFDNMLIGHKGTDVLFGRGGSDTYRASDGVDFISLSTLGVTDTANYTADGNNTIIVDPRTSGPFSYDIVFEFDPAKDKIDVSNYTGVHDYTSAAQVLSHAVDDGFGNSYIVLGDGLDYFYMVGLEKADLLEIDFIV